MIEKAETAIDTVNKLAVNLLLAGSVIAMVGLGVAWLFVVFWGFPQFAKSDPAQYLDTLRISAVWALLVAIVSGFLVNRYRSADPAGASSRKA